MKTYIIDKKTFEVYQTTDINGLDKDKYQIIEANSINEANSIRDSYESSTFNEKSIDISDLISIINNTKKSHGSNDINPTNLKFLIKEFLKK
jgi:hypothetical protein